MRGGEGERSELPESVEVLRVTAGCSGALSHVCSRCRVSLGAGLSCSVSTGLQEVEGCVTMLSRSPKVTLKEESPF